MDRLSLSSLAATMLIGIACSEKGPVTPGAPAVAQVPLGLIVSNPSGGRPVSTGIVVGNPLLEAGSTVTWISMAVGSMPEGKSVVISNRASGNQLQVDMSDGGFDPVAIEAKVDDDIDLTFTLASGSVAHTVVKVPARRGPGVVRSNPAPGRVDVALSVSVAITFSEPLNASTVNAASFRLLRAGVPVSGSVKLSGPWSVEFIPDKPLIAGSTYEVNLSEDIRDLDGDGMVGGYSSTFMTMTAADCPVGYWDPEFGCAPVLTFGSGVISGVVSELTPEGRRPIPFARVGAWIEYGPWQWGSDEPVVANAEGAFTLLGLPARARVQVGIARLDPLWDQPCPAIVELNGHEAIVNFDVFSPDRPMPDATRTPPLITGTVFEQTENGKQPVRGVWVSFEELGPVAFTTTDKDGRYALCQLPSSGGALYASKAGYKTYEKLIAQFGLTAIVDLDIELRRLP